VIATPGDDAYAAEVATWNLAVELRPPLVVGARSARDVVRAVRWATERGLAIGVSATGHGAVPNAADALLISTDRDPDLFWALRGGKGNFGVVTSYRTALQELPTFYGGGIFFDGAHAAAVLRAYRRWITDHDDRTSSSVAVLRQPPDPGLPEPIRGRHVVHVRMAHIGDSTEGARLGASIRGCAPVLLDSIGQLPAASLDTVHRDPPGPLPAHERGCLLDELTDATIDAIAEETAGPADSPLVMVEIRNSAAPSHAPPGCRAPCPAAVPRSSCSRSRSRRRRSPRPGRGRCRRCSMRSRPGARR
jgi:hypothetical protein